MGFALRRRHRVRVQPAADPGAWARPAASRSTCRRAANADPQRLAPGDAATSSPTLGKNPALAGINTFFRPTVPQLRVEVDREKTLALGVPVDDVFDALQAHDGLALRQRLQPLGRTYRVQMQAEAAYRAKPDDLGRVYVRSRPAAR